MNFESMSIKYKLNSLRRDIYGYQNQIEECRDEINELTDLALNVCDHVYSTPIKGYEHEGGTCIKCGLNQIYIACNRRK